MQPPTASPREALTEAEVVAIIRDAASLRVSGGLEVVDLNLDVVEDITADLVGGSVSRASNATLHGTCTLEVSRVLDWPAALIRPYTVLTATLPTGTEVIEVEGSSTESAYSDTYADEYGTGAGGSTVAIDTGGEVSARFNLGVYLPSVPKVVHDKQPETHEVQGFDIIHLLNDPVGEGYAVAAGTGYLTAVEAILTQRGFVRYVIDQDAVDKTLPIARVWPLDEQTTWLNVVNDLLGAIGYQGVWSDWDGRLRCEPYDPPRERAPEWYYTAEGVTSMLAPERTVTQDWFAVPNRWVAVRSNSGDEAEPVEGDGIWIYQNDNLGPTSVDARNGRVVTRFLSIEAADHGSLMATAQASVDADMRLPTTVEVSVSPNPLHWHFDRLYVNDPQAGAPMDAVCTSWTYVLNGSDDMVQEWSVL